MPSSEKEAFEKTQAFSRVLPVPGQERPQFDESLIDAPIPLPWADRETEQEWLTLSSKWAAVPKSWGRAPIPNESLERLGRAVRQGEGGAAPPGALELPDASRLEVGEMLARDGAAWSYSGTLGGRPVIIKIVNSAFAEQPAVLESLRRGAEAAQSIDHDSVHAPLLVGTSAAGQPAVIYGSIGGRTAYEALASGPLSLDETLALLSEIAGALVAAHERGIAHGDVRPETIRLRPGRALLSDYGFAQVACLGAGYEQDGLTFGHPSYLAPEVLQESITVPQFAGDVYALGLVVYEALTGQLPFPQGDSREALQWHLRGRMPRLPLSVPRPLTDLLLRLVAKTPERRPKPNELLQEIMSCRREIARSRRGAGRGLAARSPDVARLIADAERAGALASARAGEGVSLVRLSSSILGLVVCAATIGYFALRSPESRSTTVADPAVRSPAERTAAAKKAWEKRKRDYTAERAAEAQTLQDDLAVYAAAVRADLAAGQLDAAEARRPPPNLYTPETAEELHAIERAVSDARAQHDVDQGMHLQRLIDAGDMRGAARLALEAGSTQPRELTVRVRAWETARAAELEALNSPVSLHPLKVQQGLRANLKGWSSGGTLYPGGGFSLDYRRGQLLLADLVALYRGAKLSVGDAPADGPTPVTLSSQARRAVFLHGLALARPVSVSVDLQIVSGRALPCLMVGLSRTDMTGFGLAWGASQVTLRKGKLSYEKGASGRRVRGTPYRMELVVKKEGGRWWISGSLRDLRSQKMWAAPARSVREEDLVGRVGIYMAGDGVLSVSSFELRGLLDPEPLQ